MLHPPCETELLPASSGNRDSIAAESRTHGVAFDSGGGVACWSKRSLLCGVGLQLSFGMKLKKIVALLFSPYWFVSIPFTAGCQIFMADLYLPA